MFTVLGTFQVNPSIKFEVFIHKVDGLSDDHKIETQRDIHQRANDDLTDAGLESLHLRYQLPYSNLAVACVVYTTTFDIKCFDKVSKIINFSSF